jgi:flagellar capping protein FliD
MKKITKEGRLDELEEVMKELKSLDKKYSSLLSKNSKTEKEWTTFHTIKTRIYQLDHRSQYLEAQIRKLERDEKMQDV